MRFTCSVGVGPLPLRFGTTKEVVDALFSTFDVPSAYAGRNVSPQNAFGAYPSYDPSGRLWCVELSPRCSLLFGDDRVEVFDDESEDLLSHLSGLFGSAVQVEDGVLYPDANAYATVSGAEVVSLLVFGDDYRSERFKK